MGFSNIYWQVLPAPANKYYNVLRGSLVMIKLTRFNSEKKQKAEFVLNAEIIETIEETPDTVITLTNGKKIIVEEPMEEVVRQVVKYKRAWFK